MQEFTLLGFASHLAGLIVAEEEERHAILEEAAKIVEKEAKKEIGHYQEAAGPFIAWPDLADATVEDRINKGFPADEPLLRTGELVRSIEHKVEGHEAHIGSDNEKAEWQELGTSDAKYPIPPRSFLGGSLFRKAHEVRDAIGIGAVSYLSGKSVANGAIALVDGWGRPLIRATE